MAGTPRDPACRVNPTNEDAEARRSFHPHQLRISAAVKAHRVLAAGVKAAMEEIEERGELSSAALHSVHVSRAEGKRLWTRSTVGLQMVHGP